MAMSVAAGILQAMAKHQSLAWLVMAELFTAIIAAVFLALWMGLLGIVIALAISATFYRGICVWWYVCKVTSLRPLEFAWKALVAPVACGALGCAALYSLTWAYSPTNWYLLVCYTALFSACYGLFVSFTVVGKERVQSILEKVRHRRSRTT